MLISGRVQSDDLHDLFSLGGSAFAGTETGTMFAGAEKIFEQGVSPLTTELSEDDPSQLRNIAGVAGLERLSDAEIAASAAAAKTDEQNLMASLFAGTGVVSSLEHDSVIHASSSSTPPRNPLERQAIKVAQAAAKALRESIKATQGAKIGTVTWTGRKGDAGREKDDRPVVKTAAGLLATLRRQNKWKPPSEPMSRTASGSRSGNGSGSGGISPLSGLSGAGGGTASPRVVSKGAVTKPAVRRPPGLKVPGLAGKLREFFRGKGGKALSTEISAFGRTVVDEKDDQQMMEFRHLIKEIAVFRKGERIWELKGEFV